MTDGNGTIYAIGAIRINSACYVYDTARRDPLAILTTETPFFDYLRAGTGATIQTGRATAPAELAAIRSTPCPRPAIGSPKIDFSGSTPGEVVAGRDTLSFMPTNAHARAWIERAAALPCFVRFAAFRFSHPDRAGMLTNANARAESFSPCFEAENGDFSPAF